MSSMNEMFDKSIIMTLKLITLGWLLYAHGSSEKQTPARPKPYCPIRINNDAGVLKALALQRSLFTAPELV